MSGVEAAGFVLAAIPLVISFLEHYAEGVKTINHWRKYERELKSVCRRLRTQEELFRNTCELLLRDIVSSEQQLEALVSNPGGPEWTNPDLEQKLKSKLSSRSYGVYMDGVEDIKETVNAIKHKIGMGDSKVADDILRAARASIKAQLKRAKFTMTRQDFRDHLESLKGNNEELLQLVKQSHELEPIRQERRRRGQAQFFKHVRQCAEAMFEAVSTALRSTCLETHNVSLSLSSRIGKQTKSTKDVEFPVIISHDTKSEKGKTTLLWSEISFHLVDQECLQSSVNGTVSSKAKVTSKQESSGFVGFAESKKSTGTFSSSTTLVTTKSLRFDDQTLSSRMSALTVSSTSLNEIADLCSALRVLENTQSTDCLGLLVTQTNSFKILPSPRPHEVHDYDSCFVSLHSILHQQDTNLPNLYRLDKLRISVAVASSILHLYESKWLGRNWSKNNFFFVRRRNRDLYEQTFVSTPLPSKGTPESESGTNDTTPMPHIPNPTIFALGILLIELCLGKAIENMRLPEDQLFGKDTPEAFTNYSTAVRLLKTGNVSKEFGPGYETVADRCIRCKFPPRSCDLEDDQFRQAVYDGVVAPLEQDLMAFEGPLSG